MEGLAAVIQEEFDANPQFSARKLPHSLRIATSTPSRFFDRTLGNEMPSLATDVNTLFRMLFFSQNCTEFISLNHDVMTADFARFEDPFSPALHHDMTSSVVLLGK
jgi:hypothetical protein